MTPKSATQPDAVQALYESQQGWLHNWLRRRLGDHADAADLVQDTFVSVMLAGKVDEIKEVRPYLATIARCLLARRSRRQQLEQAYLDALAARPEEHVPSPEARMLALEALLSIDQALEGLPAKPREAFLLVHLCGAKYQEVATALNVSVSSVKQYMLLANRQVFLALS